MCCHVVPVHLCIVSGVGLCFSFSLSLHAYTETNDLLCPLFLFFCLKLWVINLPSQHLRELRGRRRKPWWTQFLPTAQYWVLSPSQLTSSLLTHSNLGKHNGDEYFLRRNFVQTHLIGIEGNNLHCTERMTFGWRTKWLFCILLCVNPSFVFLNLHFLPPFGGLGSLYCPAPRHSTYRSAKRHTQIS